MELEKAKLLLSVVVSTKLFIKAFRYQNGLAIFPYKPITWFSSQVKNQGLNVIILKNCHVSLFIMINSQHKFYNQNKQICSKFNSY